MRFATLLDPEYPPQLLTIHQRSPFVMWRGAPMADDARGVAVVGTRHPSDTGARQAEALALYARAGFSRIPAFGEYAGSPLSVCLAKPLQRPKAGG